MSSQMLGKTVNDWLIRESGLPVRVVNRCAAAGISTVGELRSMGDARLRRVPGLNSGSIRHVRRFLDLCDRVAAGTALFESLSDILDFFLKPVERDVVTRRYGLALPTPPSAARAETLQSVADSTGVTRERARQVQRRATAALSSDLAQACLDPLYGAFEEFINGRFGVATDREITEVRIEPLGRSNPSRVLLMLCNCSARIRFMDGLFTTIPADKLDPVASRLLDTLRADALPHSLDSLVGVLDGYGLANTPDAARRIAGLVLEHAGDVSCVAGERYFHTPTGAAGFVEDILRRLPAPAHFRIVQDEYNKAMRPGSRKGTGFILGVLSDETRFQRTATGTYELAT